LAGGIISLLVALGLLLANQQKISLPAFLNFSGSSSPESQLPASDTQFISYMLRSLQVIENKSKTNQKTATANQNVATNPAPVALPTLPAVGSRSLMPNQAPQVLERIYIPVYPPQAPVAQNINPATARAIAPAAKPSAKAPASPVRQSAPAPVKQSSPARQSAPIKQSAPAQQGSRLLLLWQKRRRLLLLLGWLRLLQCLPCRLHRHLLPLRLLLVLQPHLPLNILW
jgi:hypothetical protein